MPVTEKALHNNNNYLLFTAVFFSNTLFPKWPDPILRGCFKETVIWKHLKHFPWPFTSNSMLKFSSDIFTLNLPPFEMKVAQPMNKTLGQWCVFPWIQEHFLLSPCLCPWMSSLSPLSLYPVHFLPVQHNRKANLIISEQTHSLPTSRSSYSCSRLPIYHLGDEPKALEMAMLSGSESGLFY